MTSTSHGDTQAQLVDVSERPSTSASTGSSTPTFVMYDPPTSKLAFERENERSYHVFLSFRGSDMRETLVNHLYEALSAAGLHVFEDNETLEKGVNIMLTIENAIEESAVRIPIFSKGYADSTWCLAEAAAMLRTPGLVIPLFYDVDPTYVRYPESEFSPYRKSFRKHSDRFPKEITDEWKCTLQQICSRSGWCADTTEGVLEKEYELRHTCLVLNKNIYS